MVHATRWIDGKDSGSWNGNDSYLNINSESEDNISIYDDMRISGEAIVIYKLEDLKLVHDGVTITQIDIDIRHKESAEYDQLKVDLIVPNGHSLGETTLTRRVAYTTDTITFSNLSIYGGDWNNALLKLTTSASSGSGGCSVVWIKAKITFTVLDFKTGGLGGIITW